MTKKFTTIRDRIAARVRRTRKTDVFLREDFADFGSYDMVGRELRKLVSEGVLVRVGYGLSLRQVGGRQPGLRKLHRVENASSRTR